MAERNTQCCAKYWGEGGETSFQTGFYFNTEIKSWQRIVEIILVFYRDLVGEGVFSKIQLGQSQMICS